MRGIIPRALEYLFKQIRVVVGTNDAKVVVSVSYTEIYNERVKDLLAVKGVADATLIGLQSTPTVQGTGAANLNSPAKQKKGGLNFGCVEKEDPGLDIREDKKMGIVVPNLTEVIVENEDEVFKVLWKGAQNRAMASTNMNERSSRSHTILGVKLTVSHGGVVRRSKINLVDLAGSERYRTHQMARFSEQRIKELTSINQSLSALGNCISALTGKTKSHVPYRNSKLTRLLQDSLGGNCRTMFVVTVSPSRASCEETVSTLQFADRAMKVRVFATSNERLMTNDPLKQAKHEIARLKALLAAAVARNPARVSMQMLDKGGGVVTNAEAEAEAEALRDENLKMAEEISKLREALAKAKREKTKLLEAVYSSSGGGNQGDLSSLRNDHQAQLRVLDAQRVMLDQRQEHIEEAENDQEERREWLDNYHTWLRILPGSNQNLEGVESTLYDRLCMMETSVLFQSQELKRTKRLFLRDKERLELQLVQSLEEVEGRDKIISERDKDNEERVQGLRKIESELKKEIDNLKLKLRGQQKMIHDVKAKIVDGAGTEEKEKKGRGGLAGKKRVVSRSGNGKSNVYKKNSLNKNSSFSSIDELTQSAANTYAEAIKTLNKFHIEHGEKASPLPAPTAATPSAPAQEQEQEQDGGVWMKYFDSTHGIDYYHNSSTNETTWEPPAAWTG